MKHPNRHCLFLDLVDDEELIRQYEEYHLDVWPEVIQSLRDAGIREMEIYRAGDRLAMVIETDEGFSFEEKNEADKANPKVQEWEQLMWKFQKSLPVAGPGAKWVMGKNVFEL